MWLARSEGHQKAEEYAAAQDEIRARMDSLDAPRLQRLFLGLLGDPVRTKIAKEASTILKGVTEDSSPPPGYSRAALRQAPYPSRPRCLEWDHVARNCKQFQNFISDTIVDWVSAGVLAVWGRVGEVISPHLVLPFTVEPSKPHLCHDERFLNLWKRDLPFKLDNLPDLPRYVLPGHFQTSFNDDWLPTCASSPFRAYLLWLSMELCIFFVFCSLPFGWKASGYIYHNLGLAGTSAAGSHGVPMSQYIDDRHVGQLFCSPAESSLPPSRIAG